MPAHEKNSKAKKQRLQMLHHHRQGCEFPMVEDLTDELSEYFDIIGISKVVSNIYRYFYDPSNRSDDPVGFLKSLVKGRRKDQRELHKAKRKWYRQLWKEWEIRDEIAKLKTLLGVLAPDMFTEEGDPKPKPVPPSTGSMDTLIQKLQDVSTSPKITEHAQYAQLELQILNQHHADQRALMMEQQDQIEALQKKQQSDVQVLLEDFEIQLNNCRKESKTYQAQGSALVPVIDEIDTHLLQTQLGQMQTVQKKQIKSLQQTQYQEMLAQHNLHKHERIQRLQSEGNKQQVSLQNMMAVHVQHEQLRAEHEDQIFDLLDEIQEQQQQAFDELLLILTNRKFISLREPPEQILKRTQQQLQQLHSKQKVQLFALQNEEMKNLERNHKISLKEIQNQVKFELQSLPKQVIQSNLIHHQEAQIKKLTFLNEETKELISIINNAIDQDLEIEDDHIDHEVPPIFERTKSDEVLNSINQIGALQENLVRVEQQMIQQELPFSTLPKISDEETNFRKIQDVIIQQQRRIQQQLKQQMSLRSILGNLHELVSVQNVRVQGLSNPYRESQVEILEDCRGALKRAHDLCLKQRMRKHILLDLEEDINTFQATYWKNRKKMEEPIDDLGRSLLRGKLVKGNKKEIHPLQKILFENQNMQLNHASHQQKLVKNLKKAHDTVTRTQIEQEVQLRKQQGKLMNQMLRDTEEIEDDQNEETGPLDIQQCFIEGLSSIQNWMKEIINLQNILIEKCAEKGLIRLMAHQMEMLETLYLQTYNCQDEYFKMVSARQEELISHHQKIGKSLSPKQLILTEEQLANQKMQLNVIRRDLHNYFKQFTDPFKSNKQFMEEADKLSEFDSETKEILEILKTNLVTLFGVLKEREKQLKVKMQEIAQQVLKHQQKFIKLQNQHHRLMAQYEDLHIDPDKQMLIDLLSLHKRLVPCLKIQHQRVQQLMYRLRKGHGDSEEEVKGTSEEAEKEILNTPSERSSPRSNKRTSRLSQMSITSSSSGRKLTMTGVMKAPGGEEGEEDEEKILEPLKQASDLEFKIRAITAEKKKSLSRVSIMVSELDLTKEQKFNREMLKLITELKDRRAHMLQQVHLYNKPDSFRRVQTLLPPKGTKIKKQEEFSAIVNEYREKVQNQSDIWPSKPMELSVVEENRKQLIKLFEKSEKMMLDKGEPPKGTTLLNMLSELGVKNSMSQGDLSIKKPNHIDKRKSTTIPSLKK